MSRGPGTTHVSAQHRAMSLASAASRPLPPPKMTSTSPAAACSRVYSVLRGLLHLRSSALTASRVSLSSATAARSASSSALQVLARATRCAGLSASASSAPTCASTSAGCSASDGTAFAESLAALRRLVSILHRLLVLFLSGNRPALPPRSWLGFHWSQEAAQRWRSQGAIPIALP